MKYSRLNKGFTDVLGRNRSIFVDEKGHQFVSVSQATLERYLKKLSKDNNTANLVESKSSESKSVESKSVESKSVEAKKKTPPNTKSLPKKSAKKLEKSKKHGSQKSSNRHKKSKKST